MYWKQPWWPKRPWKRALKCIRAGAEALRLQEKTVTFEKAVTAALEARKERRIRTLYDFRYFTRRFMLRCAGLARRRVRSITPQECAEYIETAFDTPRHSKTGSARRVTIHRPLLRILRRHKRAENETICPPNWLRHWRELRRASGWGGGRKWPQDALRHTFASYHLSHFRSYAELQVEIGHRDASLLRTRYVNQRGVQGAARFWLAA